MNKGIISILFCQCNLHLPILVELTHTLRVYTKYKVNMGRVKSVTHHWDKWEKKVGGGRVRSYDNQHGASLKLSWVGGDLINILFGFI